MEPAKNTDRSAERLTLGSLFDGMGAFPLAGILHGFRPVWASEIDPDAVRVTSARFPEMRHLGDITTVDGGRIEPVSVITFGSPCQSFSQAGRREGLEGVSGLFREAVRIIHQMREATGGASPRWIVWENVPGALTVNRGADFEQIIKAIAGIKGIRIECPRPRSWKPFGTVLGDADEFGLTWVTLNAADFGLPQHRRRIFLVADLGPASGHVLRADTAGGKGASEPGAQEGAYVPETDGSGSSEAGGRDMSDPDRCALIRRILNRAVQYGDVAPLALAVPENTLMTYSADITAHTTSRSTFHASSRQDMFAALTAGDDHDPPCVFVDWTGDPDRPENPDAFVRRATPAECIRLQGFPDTWCRVTAHDPDNETVEKWRNVWDVWTGINGGRRKRPAEIRAWLRRSTPHKSIYRMCGNGIALPCAEYALSAIVKIARICGRSG